MVSNFTAFLIPLIYLTIIGCAWSVWFRRKFINSLAPAMFSTILMMMVTGMVLHRLTTGIYISLIFSVAALLYRKVMSGRNFRRTADDIGDYLSESGFYVFLLIYIAVFIGNYGKYFTSWDEFSHWGVFLKESIRLNDFYCTSSASMAHKDYVPAITVFEFLYCKLCMRYRESDAYCAIQILMFSMILPVFEQYYVDKRDLRKKVSFVFMFLFIVICPLLFKTNDGFYFYHSIYQDYIMGIMIFYCILECYRTYDNVRYQTLLLTLALSVFVLSKMIAVAFYVLILLYYAMKKRFVDHVCGKKLTGTAIAMIIVPMAFWIWYTRFSAIFVNGRGGQSYNGIHALTLLRDIMGKSAIPYYAVVRDNFWKAVISRDIMIRGSYALMIFIFSVLLIFVARQSEDNRKIYLTAIWIWITGLIYAVLMFALYLASFSEYEATRLASFERYMNSYVVAVLYIVIYIFYENADKRDSVVLNLAVIILTCDLMIQYPYQFGQMVCGILGYDSTQSMAIRSQADYIKTATEEKASVYVISQGDDGNIVNQINYYCLPRNVAGSSLTFGRNGNDVNGMSSAAYENTILQYKYLYVQNTDEEFDLFMTSVFQNAEVIKKGRLYQMTGHDSQILLTNVPDESGR